MRLSPETTLGTVQGRAVKETKHVAVAHENTFGKHNWSADFIYMPHSRMLYNVRDGIAVPSRHKS